MNAYTRNVLKIIKDTNIPENFCASSPSKISMKGNNSFSLPAGPKFSCPGATKACEGCYAQSGRHHFPAVQKKFLSNWLLFKKLRRNGSVKTAAKKILETIPKGANIFRIHESGDFNAQWYIKVWAQVVRQRKDVRFWAYTRSFHLDFTPLTRLPNFTLWASTDSYNETEAKQFVRRFRKSGVKHAYGPWEHDKVIPENSVLCPAVTGQIDEMGACEKCMLCVVKKRIDKNIVFLKH